jgi:hypothetical protein
MPGDEYPGGLPQFNREKTDEKTTITRKVPEKTA